MPASRHLALPRATASTGLLRRLLVALSMRRSRARLGALDDHILRDIGLSRAEPEAEARRPVRDVPDHWRKR